MPRPQTPTRARQRQRLNVGFSNILRSLRDIKRGVDISADPSRIIPGRALVFEISGSITKFYQKADQIPDVEFLFDEDVALDQDEDFYFDDEKKKHKKIGGSLYAIMPSEASLKRLVNLFDKWSKDDPLDDHKAYRDLFQQLKSIRPWGPQDRLPGVTRDNWEELLSIAPDRPIRFETELFFRNSSDARNLSEQNLISSVQRTGGKVVSSVVIEEIAYHSFLIEAPAKSIKEILANDQISLAAADEIFMMRPEPSVMFPNDNEYEGEEESVSEKNATVAPVLKAPIAAVFDGVPMQGHELLKDHVQVEDPWDLEKDVIVAARQHGTGMSSLIIHGDLHAEGEPIKRSIVVQSLMTAEQDFNDNWNEVFPKDRLPADLLYEAVHRIKSGYADSDPTHPDVVVINHSLGDYSRPYVKIISPWARLLDWLSYKYRLLFIVSAGNIKEPIRLEAYSSLSEFEDTDPEERSEQITNALVRDRNLRTVLSPAEGINILTVGASHSDELSDPPSSSTVIDPFLVSETSNLSSALGHGHLKSLKPEICVPGGRELVKAKFDGEEQCLVFPATNAGAYCGQKMARPLPGGKSLWNKCGTSNAAALTTRAAIQLYDILEDLGDGDIHQVVDPDYEALLLKALLVHGARWPAHHKDREDKLKSDHEIQWNTARSILPRMTGYGFPDFERVKECTKNRATVFSYGTLTKNQEAIIQLPLPESLESVTEVRNLWVTLAWFSPINMRHKSYKRAKLSILPLKDEKIEDALGVDRRGIHQPHHYDVNRGTIKHDVYSGEKATPYINGGFVNFRVACPNPTEQSLDDPVPFSVVVTVEVGEESQIPVYDEIQERISEMIREQEAVRL